MKQVCVKIAVVMAINAPVWGIVSISAVDLLISDVVQQLELEQQRAEARNERKKTNQVEIEGIRTSTDIESTVDGRDLLFLLLILNLSLLKFRVIKL